MLTPAIEIAQADDGWSVRWETRIAETFADVAAAVRYAQRLSIDGKPPRVRVYLTPPTDGLGPLR